MSETTILTEIVRVNNEEKKRMTDSVIREISFDININGERFISIAALPKELPELALGFIFSEGLVLDKSEITDIKFFKNSYKIDFTLNIPEQRLTSFYNTGEKTSGCGSTLSSSISENATANFPIFSIDSQKISELIRSFQKSSDLFFQTGGVHSAALVVDNKIKYFSEDIGRHNAVDKICGKIVRDNIKTDKAILLSSGRISSEIIKKAVRMKIPMIVSQSATTSEAISLAWKYKVYLLGFARAKRFNIYTGFEKLIVI